MALSENKKAVLEVRYEIWGLEEVRKELQRPGRDQIVDHDVTDFAQEWVEAKEAKIRRDKWDYGLALLAMLGFFLGLASVRIPM